MRDWDNHQSLLDDIGTILEETLRTELDIRPKDYSVSYPAQGRKMTLMSG